MFSPKYTKINCITASIDGLHMVELLHTHHQRRAPYTTHLLMQKQSYSYAMLLSFCFVCEMIIKQMMISFFPSIDLTANKRERGEDACSDKVLSYTLYSTKEVYPFGYQLIDIKGGRRMKINWHGP